MLITSASRFVRSRTPMTSPVDDELVMFDASRGYYYGLDQTGTRIWDLLAKPQQVDEICANLLEHYDVTLDECQRDLLSFLGQLRDAGLVEVVSDRH